MRTTHVERLRASVAEVAGGPIVVPGCWDGLTGLLIEEAGFHAAFLSGGALSMTRLGRPDMGLVTASETADAVSNIRDRIELPLIVDGDTGFGNGLNVQRTARLFERAGASALQIEDQTFPKRCGHMTGKSLAPLGEAVGRIQAALDARDEMLIIARTDACAVEGLQRAVERAQAFKEAGADMIFVEGLSTSADFEVVASAFGGGTPLVHNMVATAQDRAELMAELRRHGFSIALHPLILLQTLVRQAPALLASLLREEPIPADFPSLHRLNDLLGVQDLTEKATLYGG